MISNVTSNSSTADTTSSGSAASNSNITEVNGLFGKMFIQNLGGADPTLVGWDFGPSNIQLPPGMTMADLNASSSAASSSTPEATPAATPAATTVSTPVATAPITSGGSGSSLIPGVQSTDPNAVLNAQQVFGSSPWMSNPTVTGPAGSYSLNPEYFASQQTAQMVAQMVGGTVVPVNNMANTPGNVNSQNMPNEMVELSDGGMINAGLVAGFFSHGYSLSMVQSMIQNEVTNVEAQVQSNQGAIQA